MAEIVVLVRPEVTVQLARQPFTAVRSPCSNVVKRFLMMHSRLSMPSASKADLVFVISRLACLLCIPAKPSTAPRGIQSVAARRTRISCDTL